MTKSFVMWSPRLVSSSSGLCQSCTHLLQGYVTQIDFFRATLLLRLTRQGRNLIMESGSSTLDVPSTLSVGEARAKPRFYNHPVFGLMELSDSSEDEDIAETHAILLSRPSTTDCVNSADAVQDLNSLGSHTEVHVATVSESANPAKFDSARSDSNSNRGEQVSLVPASYISDSSANTKELMLLEMGFSLEQARRALIDSVGNLDEAVELLMNGQSEGGNVGHVLDIICDLLRKRRGPLLVSELLDRVFDIEPSAQTEITEAGGIKEICARHGDILEFVPNSSAGIIRLRSVGQGNHQLHPPPAMLGHGQTRITGAVTNVHGRSFFMESSPGVSDVFIPESAYSRWRPGLNVGEVLSVAAVAHSIGKNKCKWRAMHILANEEASLQVVGECHGSTLHRFMGTVTNSHKGSFFMESSPGNSDVFVPQSVVAEYGSRPIFVGAQLTVEAVENHSGRNRWMAVRIVPNEAGGGMSAMDKQCKSVVVQNPIDIPAGSYRGHVHVPEQGMAAAGYPAHSLPHAIVPAVGIPPTNHEASDMHAEHRNEANPDVIEWNGTQEWTVIQCLLALVRKSGFFSGADLSVLYKRHPQAAQEIRLAGGLRAFCKQHAENIEYVEDGCSGRVISKKDASVANAPHAHFRPNAASRGTGGNKLNAFSLLQPNDAGSSDESSDEQRERSVTPPSDKSVFELTNMGFEGSLAIEALRHVGGDVQRAIDWMYALGADGRSNADVFRESKSHPVGSCPSAPVLSKASKVASSGVARPSVTTTSVRTNPNLVDHHQQATQSKQAGNIQFLQGRHKAAQDEYTRSLFHYSEVPRSQRSQELLLEVGEAHVLRAVAYFQIGSFLETVADCKAAVEHSVSAAQVLPLQAWARLELCEARMKNSTKCQLSRVRDPEIFFRQVEKLNERWKADLEEIDMIWKEAIGSQMVDHSHLFGANSRPECIFELGAEFWRRLDSNKQSLEVLLEVTRHETSASVRPESAPPEAFSAANIETSEENISGEETKAAATLRVICPNKECHCVLVMHYDRELHKAWGSTPCKMCGRQYPWYLFPELAQVGLPECVQAVWNKAKQSLAEGDSINGERFVEEARQVAVKKGLDQVPSEENRYTCIYDRNCDKSWGCEVPQKLHSGTKLLLSHCIHVRDQEMLKYFTQFPIRLEEESQNDLPLLLEKWISRSGSWFWYILQGGGLELAMDSDDQVSAAVKDRLVWTLFSSIISLANQCKKKCSTFRIDNSFYWPLLEAVLIIPELTSPGRIDLAVRVLKGLKILEAPPKSVMFSSFVCHKNGFEGWSIMGLACSTRRADLISVMLEIAPHLVHCEGRGSVKPLHTVCSLPPLNFCPTVSATFPHYKKTLDFTSYGYQWQLQVSKGDSGARSKQLNLPSKLGKSRKVDQVDFSPVPASSIIVNLILENASSFPVGLTINVDVKLKINVCGSDIVTSHSCTFSCRRISSDPFEVQLSSVLEKKYSGAKDAWVQFTITRITPHNAGIRSIRDSDCCLLEQCKIVDLLLSSDADKDSYTSSGRNAFSLALESCLSEEICRLVFPYDLPRAINAALARKELNVQEFTALLEKAPADLDASEIQIASLVAKMVRYQPGEAVHSYLLQMLEWFLKIGPNQAEVESALQGALDAKDWITMDKLLKCSPRRLNCKALGVHDIIVNARPELLCELLEAGASANACRTNLKVDGETPLHVAARFGKFECIQILIDHKGDCNLKERKSGNTALHEAASALTGEKGQRIIQLMLQNGADPTILNARKSDSVGCAKDKNMKKLLEQFVTETKSHAKKCLLEKQTKADISHVYATDILASEQVCQFGSVARPVLEPKVSDSEGDRTAFHTLEEESSLPHDVRVANLFEYLDSCDDRLPEMSHFRPERTESETKSGRSLFDGIGSIPSMQFEDPELCSLVCAVEDSVWDIRFTREFKEHVFELKKNVPLLLSFLRNLGRIAQGEDASDIIYQLVVEKLQIYETPFTSINNKLSFVWQITPDYSPRIRGFTDTIRLWRICADQNEVMIYALFDLPCSTILQMCIFIIVFLLIFRYNPQ
jgi:hypothetical protein